MQINNIEKELDNLIELFFFHPYHSRDEYIKKYKSYLPQRSSRENGYRYSNLFFCFQNIKHTLGIGKEFNSIRRKINPAHFASVLLSNIAVQIISRQAYSDNAEKFLEKYLNIHNKELRKALREARNAIEHSGYSLYLYRGPKQGEAQHTKYYFGLGLIPELVKKVDNWNPSYSSKMYLINPRRLYTAVKDGAMKLKEELLDHSNIIGRKYFKSHVDVDNWIFIREQQ